MLAQTMTALNPKPSVAPHLAQRAGLWLPPQPPHASAMASRPPPGWMMHAAAPPMGVLFPEDPLRRVAPTFEMRGEAESAGAWHGAWLVNWTSGIVLGLALLLHWWRRSMVDSHQPSGRRAHRSDRRPHVLRGKESTRPTPSMDEASAIMLACMRKETREGDAISDDEKSAIMGAAPEPEEEQGCASDGESSSISINIRTGLAR
jgi:hypothetical protein